MAAISPCALLSLCRTTGIVPCRQQLEHVDLASLLPALLNQDDDAAAKTEAQATLAELKALVAAGSAVLAAVDGEGAGMGGLGKRPRTTEEVVEAMSEEGLDEGKGMLFCLSAREQVLTNPHLLAEIMVALTDDIEETSKLSFVNCLWRDVSRRLPCWKGMAERLPAPGPLTEDPCLFIHQYGHALCRTPLVQGDEWLRGIDVLFELYDASTNTDINIRSAYGPADLDEVRLRIG
jgi:hypothetical protein